MITLLLAGLAHAATLTVDDDGPADFTSIQAAIDAAGPGDVIEVAPGIYTESAVISSRYAYGLHLHGDITVRGAGVDETIVRTRSATAERTGCFGIIDGVVQAVVESLTCIHDVPGTATSHFGYAAFSEGSAYNGTTGTVTFRHVAFSVPLSRNKAIVYHNNANLFVRFENSIVDFGTGTEGAFSYSNRSNSSLSLHNSIVVNTSASRIQNTSAWDVTYTLTHPASVQPGTGNLSGDPLFSTDPATPYVLLPGSPAIDAGNPSSVYDDIDGSRNDMGVYGGPDALLPGLACPSSHDIIDLPGGGTACIHPTADVDDLVALGDGVRVDSEAVVATRTTLGAGVHIGAGAIIGRRSTLGANTTVADDAVIGRAAQIGASVDIGSRSAIGYAATVGAGTELGADSVLGALTSIGPNGRIGTGASVVLARGASLGADADIVGMGIIGPETTIGDRFMAEGSFRLRKQADVGDDVTLADGVRIGRSGQVIDDADLGDSVTLGANACASGVVADDTTIARGVLCE